MERSGWSYVGELANLGDGWAEGLRGKNSRMAHAFLVCTAQWWWWNKVDGGDTIAQTYQLLVKYYQVYGFLDAL